MSKKVTTIAGLPVYLASLKDEEDGMFCISLVDYPAVECDFLKYAKTQKTKTEAMFSVADESERLVHGVIMRANYPIYRREGDFEYFVVFTREMIREMSEKYLTDGFANSVDIQHDGILIDGVHLTQWYIKDSAKGLAPKGFEDIEEGSLFGEFKVHNDEVWERVKAGELRGFSIEIFHNLTPSASIHSEEKIADIVATLKTRLSKDMSLRTRLRKLLASFGAVTTDRAVLHWEGDEDLAVGMEVFVESEEGESTPAEDGEYAMENGTIIVVADGVVAEIREPEEETETDEAEETETETEAEEENPAEETPETTEEVVEVVEEVVEDVDNIEGRIASLEARIAELENIIDALMGGMEARSLHKRFQKTKVEEKQDEMNPFERAREVRKALRNK